MIRRRPLLVLMLAGLALIVGGAVMLWLRSGSSSKAVESKPRSQPTTLQAKFTPVTGIRSDAPTLLSGAILNLTGEALPTSFTVSDLPPGMSIASVVPSVAAPLNGNAWSCSALTCSLLDATGAPVQLSARTGAEVMLALTATNPIDPSTAITITPSSGAAESVPLSLPDDAPPLAANAISVDVSGPTSVVTGSTTTASVRVGNLSPTATTNGISVTISVPTMLQLSAVPTGNGWNCSATQCNYSGAVAPFTIAPPLALSLLAPENSAGGSGQLTVSATSTVLGTPLTASGSLAISTQAPVSHVLSTRMTLDNPSVSAPATVNATAVITPTGLAGQAQLSDPVSISLDLPDGLRALWGSVAIDGPWSCSVAQRGCSSTGPLVADVPTVLSIPITVATGIIPGTEHLELLATVGAGDSARAQRSSTATLVVVPSPVAELRAVLQEAGDGTDAVYRTGSALNFSTGQVQTLSINVINQGSVALEAGQTISVTATPDADQQLEASGGNGWSCRPSAGTIKASSALSCSIKLVEDLDAGAVLQLPFSIGPAQPGIVNWTLAAGSKSSAKTAVQTHTQVVVSESGPNFTAGFVSDSPLYNGGTGDVTVTIANRGTGVAYGGIVVINVPKNADLVSVTSPTWTCVNASVSRANGSLTCVTAATVQPGTSAPSLTLELGTQQPTTEIELSAWASATGQYDTVENSPVVTSTIPVAGSLTVDAGQDITVVTPQLAPDGTVQPAVVTLTGTADLASAARLEWTQLCVQPSDPTCGGNVAPAVSWNGVAPGQNPTTLTATFTAPPQVITEQDLLFQLTGQVGSRAISDQITVHLVPATITSSSLESGAGGESMSLNGTDAGPTPLSPPTTQPPNLVVPVSASIASAGTVLQVPTEAQGQLIGSGTGVGTLSYSWEQTSGPTASVIGVSSSLSTLLFVAPLLEPDQQSTALSFELTVTDSTGAAATSSVDVQVVWGDTGLSVVLANGASNVVTTVGAPVSISSFVSSRGMPYSYSWSIDGVDLPSGTATDLSTLSFLAGPQPGNATASLTVTDSFNRVTTASIPLIVSGIPNGQIPAAFCAALRQLAISQTATLSGVQEQIVITAATVNGSVNPTCTASATASISAASVSLPGGISLANATGQLTIAGLTVSSGVVTVPSNWGVSSPTLGGGGLFLPFVSTDSLGTPTGSITATGVPFWSLTNWNGATTVTFVASPTPQAAFVASSAPTSGTGTLQVSGTSIGALTQANMSATGLVSIGSVDIPLVGTASTSSATSAVNVNVNAMIVSPVALGGGVTIAAAQLAWTPTSAIGPVVLTVGSGPSAVNLYGIAAVTSSGTQFTFSGGPTQWTPAPNLAPLQLSGTGSVQGSQLVLALTSTTSSGTVAQDISLSSVQATLTANCVLDGSQSCAPVFTVNATATSPLFANATPLSGTMNWGTQVVALTGTAGTLTVAPIVVTNTTLTVTLNSMGPASVSGAGTTSGIGATGPASIEFGPSSTSVAVPLGTQTVIAGWTIPAVTAYATTVSTTQTIPAGILADAISIPLPTGQLTAVGLTQLPSALTTNVLPADVSVAVATYAVTSTPPTTIALIAPVPQGWYLAGDASSAMSLQMNTIGFIVNVGGSTATINVSGTGTFRSGALQTGASPTSQPLTFAGTLSTGSVGATLSGTFSPAASTSWSNAFGVSGLSVANTSISLSLTAEQSTTTLNGSALLPVALAQPLGIPASATPSLTVALGSGPTCAVINLASGMSPGVNIGGAGFLTSSSASLVIAPSGCTVNTTTIQPGLVLVMDGGLLGAVSLSLDPNTFATSDKVVAPSLQVGGLTLSNATVSFAISSGVATINVSGTTTIDGASIQLSGTVTPASNSNPVGSLLLSGTVQGLTLGGTQLSNVMVSALSLSTVGSGSSTVVLTGSSPLLGATANLALTGIIQNGVIDSLSQNLPEESYGLPSGDSLSAAFAFNYNFSASTNSSTFMIVANEATLQTTNYSYVDATVTITSPSSFSLTGLAPIASELEPAIGGTVSGSYTFSGAQAGSYSFETSSSADAVIAGFATTSDVTFERTNGTESATQTATFTPGLFDDGTAVTLAGPLSANGVVNLTGSVSNGQLRGLTGNVDFQVVKNPVPQSLVNIPGSAEPWTYIMNVVFETTGTSCTLWSGNPVLSGQMYRSGSTTYYTLAGEVTFGFPDGINLAPLLAAGAQPLVLSNENAVNQQQTPTSGLSLNVGISAGAFTGSVQLSFDIANCSYSAGGIVQLVFGGGATGSEMQQALSPGSGIEQNASSLFGQGGSLPQTISALRYLMQTDQMQANYQQIANLQSAALTTAVQNNQQGQNNLIEARNQQQTATNNLNQAEADYQAARMNLAGAQSQAQFAQETNELAFAGDILQDAQTNLVMADAGVNQAQATLGNATTALETANRNAQNASTTLDDLNTQVEIATEANNTAQQQAQESNQIKLLVLTLDYTHCTTCEIVDSASIDGSVYLAEEYIVDIDAELTFNDQGVDSLSLTVSGGIQIQENPSVGFLGIYFNAEALLTGSATYSFVESSFSNWSIVFTATADIQVYANLYFTTLNATLAQLTFTGGFTFDPFAVIGSVYVDIFGFSGDVNF